MNILNKLSIKNLKLNKKRTISTIIGIVLSVALICAVSTMSTSFQNTLVQNAINESGYYHLKISDIDDNSINEIKNNRDVKEINEVEELGYSKLDGSKNEYKPYLHLYSMNIESYNALNFELIEGRFPNNENEILISEHIKSNAKVDFKVGDEITLDLGRRMSDGYELDDSNPLSIVGDLDIDVSETLEVYSTRKFKIVGVIKRPNTSFETYYSPGYTAITTNIQDGNKDIYITLKNPRDYKTSIAEILGTDNYDGIISGEYTNLKYDNYTVNRELLRWEVFAFSDSTVSMMYSVIGVVIAVIVFTSIFCIRNSFAIATTEKIKMYGMLASVGATRKQIKKSVIFEGMVLALIGIPLGILLGLGAVFILLEIVNLLLGNYLLEHVDGIVFSISVMSIIISVVLGFVTVYLSAIASARKASKVSPIDQLRNSNDIKIKGKKLGVPKIISKLFKTGGVLAYKNLKRSKKKYRTTVISLTISIFIFITMNAFLTNAFDMSSNYYQDYSYDLVLHRVEDLSQDEINKILSLDNIIDYFKFYEEKENYLKVKDLNNIVEIEGSELTEDYYVDYDENGEAKVAYTGEKVSRTQIVGLDDETFRKYTEKIGADYEKVKDKAILSDYYSYYDEKTNNTKEIRRYKYQKGDIITGKYGDGELSIEIGAITDIKPYGIEKTYYEDGFLIFNVNNFPQIDFTIDQICIRSDNPNILEEDIGKLSTGIDVRNIASEVQKERSMVLVIKIFLYGFITVITLIGVTNIFNTITSNMELRQKEFAMLKSIGMTKKEFNRMINLETLFYSTKSLIYGIILGLVGTYAMYKAFSVKIDSGMYIPVTPIILSIIFVFILVFIIMKYSITKINKQNTIETIRKENI